MLSIPRIVLLLLVSLAVDSSACAEDAPLADAAEAMDQAAIVRLLDAGAKVNAAQPDGMTALHWVVYHDDHSTAKLLLARGADAKAANRYGVTPLSLACTNGNAQLVERLLAAGANANSTLHGGETALMTAARTGKPDVVKLLLARGAKVDAKEHLGQTALMWAAAEGHAEVVRMLIEAGADFRASLPSGFTPLLFAAREGRMEVVDVLLAAGADVNEPLVPQTKTGGKSPLPGTSPLVMAVENGHFELAARLLQAGADSNDQRSGFTALHTLTWVRKPNRGDGDDGIPPPEGSGKLTSLELVKALVAHGADVNARLKRGASGRGILSRKGATPFLMASMTADLPLMRALLEQGADPLLPNAENSTPLMAAAGVGVRAPGEEPGTEAETIEALELLLNLGNDVNAVDDNGETAMHGAAYKNVARVVEWLADHGARIEVWNRENDYGWTPLTIAQGYRVGNFKPSPVTVAALERVMRAAGVTPPKSKPPANTAAY